MNWEALCKKHRARFKPLLSSEIWTLPVEFVDLSTPDACQPAEEHVLWVGRYDEVRAIYKQHAQYTDRALHVGLDLALKPGTPLMMPLTGRIHTAKDCQKDGDYGPMLIVEHWLDDVCFYMLYGHLSQCTLDRCSPGQLVCAGEAFATVGTALENGGWEPHVHVQMITSLAHDVEDVPGVVPVAERAHSLSIYPDPNTVLQLPGLS